MTDHDRIARKAHDLWEAEGHPHGRDHIHWHEATQMIVRESAAPKTKTAAKKASSGDAAKTSKAVKPAAKSAVKAPAKPKAKAK